MSGRSIAVLTIVNGAGAVVAILTSAVTAHLFGTGRALEVFFAASTLLSLIVRLMQAGQLAEIYLPGYHQLRRERGVIDAQRSFSVIVNWMLLSGLALSVILWLVAPWLILALVPGFSEVDRATGTVMFRWLLPLLLCEIITALVQTLSNAESWFGRPESVNVLASAVTLGTLLLFVRGAGIWAMVISLWCGKTVQLVGFASMARHMGYRHRLILHQDGFSVRELFAQLVYTLGYVGATQLYAFALSAGLSLLPQGLYAVFKYVQQLYSKTQSVLLRPVSVVFFTHVSSALARGAENVRELAQTALARSLMIWSVIVVSVIVAGRPALAGLWGARRFGGENLTIAVWLLILFYALMFFSNIGQISRKTAISVGAVRRVYLYSGVVQLASAAVVFAFVPRFGIAGAAAVVAMNIIGLAFAPTFALWRARPSLVTGYSIQTLWKWALAMAVAVLVAGAVAWHSGIASDTLSRFAQIVWAIAVGAIASTVALAVAWFLNVPDVRAGTRYLWRMSDAS